MSIPSFLQLKRDGARDADGLVLHRLAVLGDSATQLLCTALKGMGWREGLALEIWEAGFDQVDLVVRDPSSELYAFAPQSVFLFFCTQKLYTQYCGLPPAERADFAQRTVQTVTEYWGLLQGHGVTRILQSTWLEQDDGVFGSYAGQVESSFLYQIRKLNFLLAEKCAQTGYVFLTDLDALSRTPQLSVWPDDRLWLTSKIAFGLQALPAVAQRVVRVLRTAMGTVKKCVVLDLDNTLWGGVISEDGLEGIELGALGRGSAFSAFQLWLKQLKERGILLAVCSKNDEDTAKLPFVQHPDMVLRLEDISVFVANWSDKASNLRTIQKTLNIGFDSMVFLDDSPFERELVRSMLPEVTVPELPEDPACYLSALKVEELFTAASFSSEDSRRTEQYRAEAIREAEKQKFSDLDGYLESLGMYARVEPFTSFHCPRIAQLTQRSNQFNLRTVRYTQADVERMMLDPHYVTLSFSLTDRFGPHGLVSVVILEKLDPQTLLIDTWLMSCRVLKRGMEEFVMNEIAAVAQMQGFSRIRGEYRPTAKNAMVANLYPHMGFEAIGERLYQMDTARYRPFSTHIKKEEQQ